MNRSEILTIDNSEESMAKAIDAADAFIASLDLDRRSAIRTRLLAEETIGMVRAMTGDFTAKFWLEEENGERRVRLTADTDMDKAKKEKLLSVVRSGKNDAAKGFMGKIRDIIQNGMLAFDNMMKIQDDLDEMSEYSYLSLGMPADCTVTGAPLNGEMYSWTLTAYREALVKAARDDQMKKAAWDELEKSIVASIAKDVIVGVRKDRVDLTILDI